MPDRLESQLTIEDPETLERAWVLELAYTHATGLDRLVHDAFDDDRSDLAGGLHNHPATTLNPADKRADRNLERHLGRRRTMVDAVHPKDASVQRKDLRVMAVLARPQLDGSFDVTERILPKIGCRY